MSISERKQYLADKIHNSKLHIKGYDPNCPKCVMNGGIKALIVHLQKCVKQNECDVVKVFLYSDADTLRTLIGEQKRMIGILKRLL